MPNLGDFLSEFKHGFQNANRFRVQLFVQPAMVLNIIAEASLLGIVDAGLAVPQAIKWLAQGFLGVNARMPDRSFSTTQMTQYGITEFFPYHAEWSALECTFLMPHTTSILRDNGIPRFFNFWQNQIQNISNGPDSGYDFRFPSNYYATAILTLLDRQDNGTISYKFDNVYPSLVHSVNLSWDQDNTFAQLPVQFMFSYFTVMPHIESVALSSIEKLTEIIGI